MNKQYKRLVFAMLSVAMLVFCSLPGNAQRQPAEAKSANTTSPNLAPNPSFEDGKDSPDGWRSEIFGEGTVNWQTSPGRTDGHSLSIGNILAGCNLKWESTTFIPIEPDHDYEISAWYINTMQTSSVAFLAVFWGERRAAFGSTGIWQMKPVSEWTHRNFLIRAGQIKRTFPNANRISLSFGASAKINENGVVRIDDIAFRDVTASK